MNSPTAREATATDVPALSQVLADAFYEDPFYRWIFPTEKSWSKGSRRQWTVALCQYLQCARVLTTGPGQGVALWAPPSYRKTSPMQHVKEGAILLPFMGLRLLTLARVQAEMDKNHPTEPHWYLYVLGVAPKCQGQGYGAALVTPILEQCDHEKISAYLETTNPKNHSFYERLGFVVLKEIEFPSVPKIWCMLRKPRT